MKDKKELNINLVREYIKCHFVDKGMIADMCFHDTEKGNPHGENYSMYLKHWQRFNELKGESQDKFYKKYSERVSAFIEAHKYMERHMKGEKKIPLYEWEKELEELTVDRDAKLLESQQLAAELKSAEAMIRNAQKVLAAKSIMPEGVQTKKIQRHGMEI